MPDTTYRTRVDEIAAALVLYLEPGQVTEVRAIGVGQAKAVCQYTADAHTAAIMAIEQEEKGARGVYFVPNPLDRNVLLDGRGLNKGATRDDVVRRRWLLIDADPGTPASTNATDAEKAGAYLVLVRVLDLLHTAGLRGRIVSDSANGYHAAYPIDLDTSDGATQLIKDVLAGLHLRCSELAGPKIDRAVHDLPRIWKVPGTLARKGPHTEERPHRRSAALWDLCEPHNADDAQANTGLLRHIVETWQEQAASLDAITWTYREPDDPVRNYAKAALDAECRTMAAAVQGERNHTLNTCAFKLGTLVGAGALAYDDVFAALDDAAKRAGCDNPEKDHGTIHRGLRDGMRQPRDLGNLHGDAWEGPHAHPDRNGTPTDEPSSGDEQSQRRASKLALGFALPIPASQLKTPEGARWILDGYLSQGSISLLSALWKSGKTTLIACLLRSMEAGGIFCGRELSPGRVLMVTEESEGRWARRRDALGLKDHIEFMVCPFANKATWDEWKAFLAFLSGIIPRRGYMLVIFDTLVNLWPVRDENDASQVQAALMPMRKLPGSAGVLLTHHNRKGDGQEATASRGSGALTGFVDTIMELRRFDPTERQDRRRVITAYSRDQETPDELVIELTEEGGYRAVAGGAGGKRGVKTLELTTVIARLLPSVEPGITAAHLLDLWPDGEPKPQKDALYRALNAGVEHGQWRCQGDGVRGSPRTFWSVPPH